MKRSRLKRKTPLRKTRRKKSLRKQLWPEFSKLIRARDKRCLKGGDCGGPLQGSHILPKGQYPLLELYPLNVKTLCWRHHWWWHHNPLEAQAWLVRTLPTHWLTMLMAAKADSLPRKGMTEQAIRAEWTQFGLGGGR